MIQRWLTKYQSLLGETRLISRIGAFVMVVLAVTEAATVIYGVSQAENPGRESIVGASVPVAVYIVVFSIRLFLLSRVPKTTVIHVATWWVAAIGVYFCAEPRPHFIYFGLEWAGLFFVFFSAVTFLILASLAFSHGNDFNSHS